MGRRLFFLIAILSSSLCSLVGWHGNTTSINELEASEVVSAEVDFDIENGSFILTYKMKDYSHRTIVLECQKNSEDPSDRPPRILLRDNSMSKVNEQVLSEKDFRSFVRERFMEDNVTNEEAGFLAVSILSSQRIADVQMWGFSSASIMKGEWYKVFLKPVSGLRPPG